MDTASEKIRKSLDEKCGNRYIELNKIRIGYEEVALGLFLVLFFYTRKLICKRKVVNHMETIDKNIAYNLKKIRKSQNLSLDMLSERTGVSKSMLGQIERSESNPTILTVAKICDGLGVNLEDLVYNKQSEVELVKKQEGRVIRKNEGKYQVRLLFPFTKNRNIEVCEIEIQPKEKMATKYRGGTNTEYVVVNQGTLIVKSRDSSFTLEEGDSVRLSAGDEYLLSAKGNEIVKLTSVATMG